MGESKTETKEARKKQKINALFDHTPENARPVSKDLKEAQKYNPKEG